MKANIKFNYMHDVKCTICEFKQPAEYLGKKNNHICPYCGHNDWAVL